MDLKLLNVDPAQLKPNPWNSNRVSRENMRKLDESIKRLDNFKPILVRELTNGSLEIIGGQHRRDSAMRMGIKAVPVLTVGVVSDIKAKEMGLADNERYGEDDADALKRLLESIPNPGELASFLPITLDEIDTFLSFDDTLEFDELNIDDDDSEIDRSGSSPAPTHRILRFKVANEDAEKLSQLIEKTIKKQGYSNSDALTNAGDALIHHIKDIW